jgi:hypothetical protein
MTDTTGNMKSYSLPHAVEAHEVVENWSVELHMDGLFAMNHHFMCFYPSRVFVTRPVCATCSKFTRR